MGEIYNQNLTIPSPSKPFFKTTWFKGATIIVAAVLISFYLIFWQDKFNLNPTNTKTAEQELRDKQRTFLSQAAIIFPNVVKTTPIKSADLPEELRDFVFTDFDAQVFTKKLEYEEQKQIGYFFNYTISNSTIQGNILEKIRDFNNTQWLFQTGLYSDKFGFMEYVNSQSKTQVRIMFTQKENNVELVVKTLQ